MKKLLIANRGEIAVRIITTARKMGIETYALYSDADEFSLHARMADHALHIGPSPSSQSYLNQNKIIQLALKYKIDAVHPGYGFLSENASFSEALQNNGITFVGPSAYSIRTMGSKLAAKNAVLPYGIPMVPGTDNAISNIENAIQKAKEIGFPILIKASAGGGGKGMRIVKKQEYFEEQLERAISEAESSFGDGSVFIEKYISSPRHIEFQILADNHGNVVHFFERECSIQRRHQKVIEEAPSCILDEELRKKMGGAAIKVAKACQYSGTGTVEFLLDKENNFYFLEMNTRLQVEHPVTEFITGVDFVQEQIKVARNEALKYKQKDIQFKGHAIELRVYAEDPDHDFVPNIGTLEQYQIPEGDGIRVDNGYEQGDEIPIYYDPLISKLICFANNRKQAIDKLYKAIQAYQIKGIKTTLPFGEFVCLNEEFISGNFDTHFVENHFSKANLQLDVPMQAAALATLKIYLQENRKVKIANQSKSNWQNQ